ncbi:hypothetical protein [Lapillicoccus sp.]|uniref:hypothetical protein n=1 Tax=Lapillicoccus sp. TaxID=1909287 RepID=UPI00326699A3
MTPTRRTAAALPTGPQAWAGLLDQLTRRLETGLIYERDLDALRPAMERLVAAYNSRQDHLRP